MVTILVILALICEVLAALGVKLPRVDLLPLGIAFYFASLLVGPLFR